MQSEKYRQLVDKLAAKTARRELDWREGLIADSFQVSFPNYSLVITELPLDASRTSPSDITLSIVDMNGATIDTIHDFEVDGEERERPYHLKMRELYRAVRQQVLGADRAVEEILSELGE